ncbi:BUD13 homolog isoform X1 [Mobula birostris]|uniref:BUD13 homolog isoform X1 n=2 Tax=Mobula birostris TaxID=1983395 RepID=UPI003B27C923
MAGLSKEEYLKRYLSSSDSGKRRDRDLPAGRKKRKVKIKGGGMRIVDDDVTWKSLAKEKALEVESGEEDEAPVVAEIIDERPVVIQRMEEFRSSNKWKILGDENADSQDSDQFLQTHTDSSILGFDSVTGKRMDRGSQLSKKNVDAVCSATTRQRHDSTDDSPVWSRRRDSPDRSPPRKGRHDCPDFSPPRRGRHDSPDLSPRRGRQDSPDLSPPRRGRHDSPDLLAPRRGRHDSPDLLAPRRGRHDSPDLSPPQRGRHDSPDLSPRRGRHDSPDLSPPWRGRHDSPDLSPPRRGRHDSPNLSPPQRGRHDSPDLSPRRGRHDSPDLSPPRRGRHDSPDLSPPRRGRHDSPDLSPPWRGRHDSPDLSPPRRGRHDSPDLSPPRRGRHDSPDLSPPRRECHDSDLSPPRKKKMENMESSVRSTTLSYGKTLSPVKHKDRRARGSPQRLQDSNSDPSPQRKGGQHSSDSDLSPPRRKKLGIQTSNNRPSSESLDMSPTQQRRPTHKHTSSKGQVVSRDSSPSRKSRGNEMLSGGQAGLVSTDTLRKEKEDRRKRERAAEHLADNSRNAVTVFRDKLGKKRDLDQERLEQKKKEEEKAAKLEKYAQWGKGVAQKEQQKQNIEDALYEMQKPFARHIDDEDLDRLLRERERDGDPMAGLIRKKKEVKNKNEKPRYNGPAPPPNRFNLYPGYRWDGVDRSNGFEKKRFARLAEKKAVQEIAYKWSVEDM